jgi:hypothetical protein
LIVLSKPRWGRNMASPAEPWVCGPIPSLLRRLGAEKVALRAAQNKRPPANGDGVSEQTGLDLPFSMCATLTSFCRETGLIPRSASRCQMIARVERALRRAFNKRAQERPLHLERFATETNLLIPCQIYNLQNIVFKFAPKGLTKCCDP